MNKFLFLTLSLAFFANPGSAGAGEISSGGDCGLIEWNLPNRGANCEYEAAFGRPVEQILFSCSGTRYLMSVETLKDGEFKGCQVMKSLLQENAQ